MNSPIRIKTFRSKTLQDAFQQIRAEFGPDASILETKAARYGIFGNSRIEVTASSKTKDIRLEYVEQNESDLEGQPEHGQATEPESPVDAATEESPLEFEKPETIRLSSGEPAGPSIEFAKPDRLLELVYQELIDAGIDAGIASQWTEATRILKNPSVTHDVWTLRYEILGWIRDLVHAAPPVDLDDSRQQVLAFIGPPGTGKTTSLAKIAANLSMESGLSVGVLSTDSLRLGSNHLLQNYAEVLGWHFDVADSIEKVPACIESFAGCRFLLIDTSGCSPSDTESIERIGQLLSLAKPTETHLVIPSTCNVRSFLRYEQAFDQLHPNRMILSRLDEAGGLGAFFTCLQSSSLPVSYLTNGQQIPADLIQATENRLAQYIMALTS